MDWEERAEDVVLAVLKWCFVLLWPLFWLDNWRTRRTEPAPPGLPSQEQAE